MRRKQNEALSKTNSIITDPEVSYLLLNFVLLAAQFFTVFWDCEQYFIIMRASEDTFLTEMSIITLNCSNLHSNFSMKYHSSSS